MNHKTSLLNDLQHEHDQLDQLTQRNGLLAKDWFDQQERIKQKANELKELQEEYIELKRRVKIQKELSAAIIEHGLDAIEEYNRLSKYLDKDIYLVKDEYSIGRDVRNDIIVRNAECSRFHAVIKRSKKRKSLGIIDLKSSFGTYVNREKILSNDTVRIPDKSTIELAKDGLTFKVNLY